MESLEPKPTKTLYLVRGAFVNLTEEEALALPSGERIKTSLALTRRRIRSVMELCAIGAIFL